ncbi:transcriptional regulator [Clostridioides difficile]|uniref:BlaI/MecI/CopY family transcriptional regulator n=1 Tax=Clostridioides sp. ZZV15-6598 TaxID=2811501 RepID=UPI001D12A092|nr:BlaI/MecI/CopY family transcriptional regulator [Clostridioides sp. ZZV15-6598]MDB3084260.1 transcriptional regulator [Clostridioides difficile]
MLIQKIPQAELKIMKFIWKKNSIVTSKEIVVAMELECDWKQTTTLTLLRKLVEKNFLYAERIKRLTHYEIIITKEIYLQFITKKFLEEVHSGSIESLFSSLEDYLTINKKS